MSRTEEFAELPDATPIRDRLRGGAVGGGLRELLAADVQWVGDGGGKAPVVSRRS